VNVKALAAVVVALGVLVGSAQAARAPSPNERRELTQTVLAYFDGLFSTWDTKVSGPKPRISVATIRVASVASRPYSRFAMVSTRAVNSDAAEILLGRRAGLWRVITYGTSDVGCSENLGPRKPGVLTALELTCT
jgi:hypothetical protein